MCFTFFRMFKPDLEPDQCVACCLNQGRCCKALGRDAKGFRLLANNAQPILQGIRMLWRAKVMETAGLLKHRDLVFLLHCCFVVGVIYRTQSLDLQPPCWGQHSVPHGRSVAPELHNEVFTIPSSKSLISLGVLEVINLFWCTGSYIWWWSIAGGTSENSPFQATFWMAKSWGKWRNNWAKRSESTRTVPTRPWDSTGPDRVKLGAKSKLEESETTQLFGCALYIMIFLTCETCGLTVMEERWFGRRYWCPVVSDMFFLTWHMLFECF